MFNRGHLSLILLQHLRNKNCCEKKSDLSHERAQIPQIPNRIPATSIKCSTNT